MNKIASFEVNHDLLTPGVYVSRKDQFGNATVTTFDLRFTYPNIAPAMEMSGMHAIEHLGATFLRNHAYYKDLTVYFGPMGCRTGFYLILADSLNSLDIKDVLIEMCQYILNYEGLLPGESSVECGNYRDLNLMLAKYYIKEYLNVLNNLNEKTTNYQK